MKRIFIFFFTSLLLLSCSNENTFNANESDLLKAKTKRISINKFDSKTDLFNAIDGVNNRRRTIPSLILDPDSDYNLETPIQDVNYEDLDDDILNLELSRSFYYIDSTAAISNTSVYEAIGYDTIVPNLSFARLLNIKGEIEVADTVYKISPRGTYFFRASLEPYFTQNYETYENTDGQLIGDKIYLIDPIGIYRYKTFAVAENIDLGEEINLDLGPLYIPQTGAPTLASQVQWDNVMEYETSFHHGFSRFWHSIFGSGVTGQYKFNSHRRLLGKIYDYNYIIYRTSGAFAKMQKKNWIGWSGTEAQVVSLTWNNVILEQSYETVPPQNIYSNQTFVTEPYTQNMNIPDVIQGNVPVVSILGYEFSQSELKGLVNFTKDQIVSFLRTKTGKNVNNTARCYVLYGKQSYVTIIPDECIEISNGKTISKTFKKNWSFLITFNPYQDYGNWYNWISLVQYQPSQGFKLLAGQIKVAAKFEGNVGAFKITFINTL